MRNVALVILAMLVAACSENGPVSIDDSTGSVMMEAYLDRDASGDRNAPDAALAGVRAAIVRQQSGDTVAAGTTGADGTVLLTRIPVGSYRVVASRGELGDSVEVQDLDATSVTVTFADTAERVIRFGYSASTVSIAAARAAAAGSRVAVSGIALNATGTFGDSTVHLRDVSGAVRLTGVVAAVAAGDSIRAIGTIGSSEGQVVVEDPSIWIVRANAGVPVADSVSTAVAAGADAGARDAWQVRVRAEIVGTQPQQNGDLVIVVNDGSGVLEVVLDDDVNFGSTAAFVPGAILRGAGVLVPTGTGSWRLRPRAAADVSAAFPTLSIAELRALQPGRSAYIHGYALNGRANFSDGSVHVYDASGAIRIQQLPNTPVLMGDSVRVLGTVGIRFGQPILEGSQVVVLLAGVGLDSPDSVSTAAAAAATGDARDADHVTVGGTVSAVGNTSGGWLLTVDDGSGALQIMLDSRVGFSATDFAVDDVVRASGVLVSVSNGVWQLRPRTLEEIQAQ